MSQYFEIPFVNEGLHKDFLTVFGIKEYESAIVIYFPFWNTKAKYKIEFWKYLFWLKYLNKNITKLLKKMKSNFGSMSGLKQSHD